MLCCCGSSFFFLPLFFLFFSRQGLQLSYLFLSASSLFSLSRARLYCCEPVLFFSMRFVPMRRRNRNMHVRTLTRLLSNYTFFFSRVRIELLLYLLFSTRSYFFFLRQGHTVLQTCFFFSLFSSFPSHNFIGNLLTPFFVCWFHPLLARSSTHLYTFPFPLLLS